MPDSGAQGLSSGSRKQQQEESLTPNAAFITAAAQPTPALTVTAASGQFLAHAPHSMQASRLSITAWPFSKEKTS